MTRGSPAPARPSHNGWEYRFETEAFRIFPPRRDPDEPRRPVRIVRHHLYLTKRHRTTSTTRDVRRYLHAGSWRLAVDDETGLGETEVLAFLTALVGAGPAAGLLRELNSRY